MGLYERLLDFLGIGRSDPFQERLRAFVRKEGATEDVRVADERKLTAREKMEAARQAVDAISEEFRTYVEKRILSRYRGAFTLEVPPASQASKIYALMGETQTGNEARFVRVQFQQRLSLYVMIVALILSQSLEVKAAFVDHSGKVQTQKTELPLERYGEVTCVDWHQLFEELFSDFLDWRERSGS